MGQGGGHKAEETPEAEGPTAAQAIGLTQQMHPPPHPHTHNLCLVHAMSHHPQPDVCPLLDLLSLITRGVARVSHGVILVLLGDELRGEEAGGDEVRGE